MTAYRRPPVRAEQPQAAREQVDMHPRVLPWLGEGGSEEIVPRGRDVARAGEQEQRQTQSRRGHRLPSAERRLTAGACTPSASSALLSIAAPPRPTHSADSSPPFLPASVCAQSLRATPPCTYTRECVVQSIEWWVLSSLCAVRSPSLAAVPRAISPASDPLSRCCCPSPLPVF